MGDLLLIAVQLFTGMFIFELIYRDKVSPVSVVHHIISIVVAQAAVTISYERAPESTIEFMLCTVWGKQVSSLTGSVVFIQTRLQVHLMFSPNLFPMLPWSCIISIRHHTSSSPLCSSSPVSPHFLVQSQKRYSSCTCSEFFGIDGLLYSNFLHPYYMLLSRRRRFMDQEYFI